MSEENKNIVLSYVEAFNRGDINGLCSLFAPDALIYGVLGWGEIDKARPIWQDLINCFNINLQVEAIITEGDTVSTRYTERGKSVQSFRGGSVTGLPYEIVAMEWFIIKDGLIYRRWGARDSASQFSQMGLSR